jgi:phytanoyl-CoA hydroxylase
MIGFVSQGRTNRPGNLAVGLARRFLKDGSGVRFDNEPGTYDKNAFVPVEVKAGSLVLLHGNLVHQRCTSRSDHLTSLIVCLILEL